MNINTLPGSLTESLDEFEKDPVIKAALGPHASSMFLQAGRAVWNEYRMQVTPWETERYLELL